AVLGVAERGVLAGGLLILVVSQAPADAVGSLARADGAFVGNIGRLRRIPRLARARRILAGRIAEAALTAPLPFGDGQRAGVILYARGCANVLVLVVVMMVIREHHAFAHAVMAMVMMSLAFEHIEELV